VLQRYVLSQALERLSTPVRGVLAAVARVGIVSESELRLMTDDAATVVAETRASPFCIEAEDGLSLHPLARAALRADALGIGPLRDAARALADDNPMRAARFFLASGDDDAAAGVLDTRIMPFLSVQPTSELAGLVADIRPDVLVRHQATWSATLHFRAYAVSPHRWLQEARQAFETLTPGDPKTLWFGVGVILLNFLCVSAEYAEAERVSATLFALFAEEGENSPYQIVLRLWRRFGELRQGQAIDLEATWAECEPVIGSIPASVTQFLIAFNGPIAFFRGDIDEARRALDRAIDLSLDPAAEMSQVLALKNAAFFAWLAGDTDAFSSYIKRLVRVNSPNVARGIRHFLGCALDDHPADTPIDFEMLYTRAFGALIAASREHELSRRIRALRLAEDAAIEDAQPWLCALVQLAIGLSVPGRRAEAFAAAMAAGDRSGYAAFRANVASIIAGRIPDTWKGLTAFSIPTSRELSIRFGSCVVSIGEAPVTLAQREMELLLVLALTGGAHDRRTLAAILWPDRDEAGGANAVRVLVSRLRRKLGAAIVRSTPAGYELATEPDVDLFTLETALAAGTDDRISRTLHEQLLDDYEHLPTWMLSSEWLRPYVRRYEAAVRALRGRAAAS
jgi:tetratricopeptide (TPR) repeat protein